MSDVPQLYLRRCNGYPRQGITINRGTVESVLALAQGAEHTGVVVEGDLETGLIVRVPAGRPWEVEPPGTTPRTFTYSPLPGGQRRASTGD